MTSAKSFRKGDCSIVGISTDCFAGQYLASRGLNRIKTVSAYYYATGFGKHCGVRSHAHNACAKNLDHATE